MHEQRPLDLPAWGGRRRGAGRPPACDRDALPHAPREQFRPSQPVHVTLRVADHELRPINGMQAKAPGVAVVVGRVRANRRNGQYELHIARILSLKNWPGRRRAGRLNGAKRRDDGPPPDRRPR